jgi:membrane protease YdiL (CAAX protease family)
MPRYYTESRSAYYGVWCALPLLGIYEVLLWIVGPSHGLQVRNAADVWFRILMESLGVGPFQTTLVLMGLLVASIPLLRRGGARLKGSYLAFMAGEALIYSLALGLVINLILFALVYTWLAAAGSMVAPLSLSTNATIHALRGIPAAGPSAIPGTDSLLGGIALSLGAGLFEEFAFRVVLLTLLLGLFRLILRPAWAAIVAILLAALAFAWAHYVGSLGEDFDLHSFLFRFFAGLVFTLLYYQRGFAITAYAHAMYDIWVLLV